MPLGPSSKGAIFSRGAHSPPDIFQTGAGNPSSTVFYIIQVCLCHILCLSLVLSILLFFKKVGMRTTVWKKCLFLPCIHKAIPEPAWITTTPAFVQNICASWLTSVSAALSSSLILCLHSDFKNSRTHTHFPLWLFMIAQDGFSSRCWNCHLF